ncbi:hypothetical protein [Paenibacillus sp. Soil787]|uniref:hypothetical protein n=1 Tax=Paenibacillus sp. Soil787 TaxID=1736411 RepID=UPI00070388AE|nr:hypothetical protein [Paenibacillus sp. Soil787]KRF23107.1 hypothetical protein ASG93_29475 [Paenibacillus sp. Soil787]
MQNSKQTNLANTNRQDLEDNKRQKLENNRQQDLDDKRKAWIGQANALIPLLFIWGAEWMFSALIDVAIYWRDLDWLKQAAFITAVVASLIQIWSLRKEFRTESGEDARERTHSAASGAGARSSERSGWGHPALLVLPGAMLIAAVALLEAIGAVSPLFAPVLRTFILAIGFVQVGLLLGRPLVYLGLWLFALSALMGVWYLGYSGVVLEGMGGISLILSGYMLRVWGR